MHNVLTKLTCLNINNLQDPHFRARENVLTNSVFQAGDYVLVQLMLNQRSEQSKQKLLAPGLVVKSPEHSGDVTFIILLFTGERLIASRHDVIKVMLRYN